MSESCPVATETVNAEGLRIEWLNSSGAIVSIAVVGERSGTLLNQSLIPEGKNTMTFPVSHPAGWILSQDFNMTLFSEGFNATVVIEYSRLHVAHADGSVWYTFPAFYEIQNLGFVLLAAGLVLFAIGLVVILARNRGWQLPR